MTKYVAIVAMLAAGGMAAAQTAAPPAGEPTMDDGMHDEMMTPPEDAPMPGHAMPDGMAPPPAPRTMPHDPTQPHIAPPATRTTPSGNPVPAPGQMAHPSPAGQAPVAAQRLDTYRPQPRAEYPRCSRTVTDNCVQRNDPGGN